MKILRHILHLLIFISLIFKPKILFAIDSFDLRRVAHAGGQYQGVTYTNSYEALDFNYENGFTYFELDFSFTQDGKLVCIHDWNFGAKKIFGFSLNERPTLEQYQYLIRNVSKYEGCTLQGLAEWLIHHPDAIIITDVKDYENNVAALNQIADLIPDYSERIIPQIYDPQNYDNVKTIGFKSIIWTLYRYNGSDEDVLRSIDEFQQPFAVTVSTIRINDHLLSELKYSGTAVYLHTVNDYETVQNYLDADFQNFEIYTDYLSPITNDLTAYVKTDPEGLASTFNLKSKKASVKNFCNDMDNNCFNVEFDIIHPYTLRMTSSTPIP